MSKLDPRRLFKQLSQQLPAELRAHVLVIGSLAAARAFVVRLGSEAVNTQDADLLIHPAGDVASARRTAERLLEAGWTRVRGTCFPMPNPEPASELRLIRLNPPEPAPFFVEFVNVPMTEQVADVEMVPVKLPDGYYGLKSYRFMGLAAQFPRQSDEGLFYAAPEMMALSNLLSHREVGSTRIASGVFQGTLRSAKDLGRVLALAHLAEADVEGWPERWLGGLRACFPRSWREHAKGVGAGLQQLLEDDDALAEAVRTTEYGLLNQMGVDAERLRAVGERFDVDVIRTFQEICDRP
jgi:hypothetical protein